MICMLPNRKVRSMVCDKSGKLICCYRLVFAGWSLQTNLQ
nr:hypothetical protein [uncultured bacterium]